MKELIKEEFNLKLIKDLGMVDGKRSAILLCPYCTKEFQIRVTSKSKKQQGCISCRSVVLSLKSEKKRETLRKTVKEKLCNSCKEVKTSVHFSKREASADGISQICKVCATSKKKKYLQTKIGCITQLYNTQCNNSRLRAHPKPNYTREELINKYIDTRRFISYFTKWENEGFTTYSDIMPSFDRKDDTKPYTLDNIQLTTYKKNLIKEHLKYKTGKSRNTYISPVLQLTTHTNEVISSFYSINEAERATSIKAANISKVCRNERSHAGGYYWKYN